MKINKETALKYFNHLKDCNSHGTKEIEMINALQDDESFKQIEVEFKEAIEEIKKQLPEKRLSNLACKIKESFQGDSDEEEGFEDDDENISYDSIVEKLINNREYDGYDDLIFQQRLSFDDMNDEILGRSGEIELEKVIESLEKIKAKYPGQKIFINTIASGTMSVDRIRVYAVSKKTKPLYKVYSHIYNIVRNELRNHEQEIAAFKRKQKELGL